MTWLQTVSGQPFDLLAPKLDQVDFDEIAHALSFICRFAGHTKEFYSVAEHCCRVADILPVGLKLYGLLHDAKEAYIGDITTPVKWCLPKDVLRRFEAGVEHPIDAVIYEAAGLNAPSPEIEAAVKYADVTLLMTEKRDLMERGVRSWDAYENYVPLKEQIRPWQSGHAKREFLHRLNKWRRVP